MIEVWRPVVGHGDAYEVSDHGRVRSVDRTLPDGRRWKARPISLHRTADGHAAVNLTMPKSVRLVHHLVLESFVGPRPDGAEGLHWDDDGENNHVNNLRWGTRSENLTDAVRNERHKWAKRTHCAHKHLLRTPNLVRADLSRDNRRRCLACSRARHSLSARGLPFDVAVADNNYSRIMKEASNALPN